MREPVREPVRARARVCVPRRRCGRAAAVATSWPAPWPHSQPAPTSPPAAPAQTAALAWPPRWRLSLQQLHAQTQPPGIRCVASSVSRCWIPTGITVKGSRVVAGLLGRGSALVASTALDWARPHQARERTAAAVAAAAAAAANTSLARRFLPAPPSGNAAARQHSLLRYARRVLAGSRGSPPSPRPRA